MKFRRTVGGAVLAVGCAVLILGMMGFLLPEFDNVQLKVVIRSFQESASAGSFVGKIITSAMSKWQYCCMFGVVMVAVGFIFLLKRDRSKDGRPESRKVLEQEMFEAGRNVFDWPAGVGINSSDNVNPFAQRNNDGKHPFDFAPAKRISSAVCQPSPLLPINDAVQKVPDRSPYAPPAAQKDDSKESVSE